MFLRPSIRCSDGVMAPSVVRGFVHWVEKDRGGSERRRWRGAIRRRTRLSGSGGLITAHYIRLYLMTRFLFCFVFLPFHMTWLPLLFVCLAASTLRVFRVDLVQITYNHVSRMLFNSDDFSSNFKSRIFFVFCLSVFFFFQGTVLCLRHIATNVLSDLKLVYITWSKFQFLFRLV